MCSEVTIAKVIVGMSRFPDTMNLVALVGSIHIIYQCAIDTSRMTIHRQPASVDLYNRSRDRRSSHLHKLVVEPLVVKDAGSGLRRGCDYSVRSLYIVRYRGVTAAYGF